MPTTLAVPRKGPFLLFDAADLPGLRQRFDHPDCRPLWQHILTHCDLMLMDDPPPDLWAACPHRPPGAGGVDRAWFSGRVV